MTLAAADGLGSEPVRAASIRTLFQQIPNSFAAAAVVTVYMAATAIPTSAVVVVGGWLAVQLATQAYRAWLLMRYRRIPPDDAGQALERAASLNSGYMLLAGLVWGSTAFLFMRADAPITVALTLCGLYGIAGGSVPGNAYNPSGLYLFIWSIFGAVMIRMLMFGDYGHIVLGVASLCFAGILTMFCRVQSREIREGFAIRFENTRLLAALEVEKGEAEAARGRAEQANLAKSQLLAAASHDLRQPLHALTLFSESLASLSLDAAARDVAGRIQSNVAAMETLFNGLLDISRLEAGVVRTDLRPMALRDLFDRLAAYFEPSALAKGLSLRFRDTELWVESDAALLEQILVNLITNAIRYTERGGLLVAARRRGARDVAIEVVDTGVGIADIDRERIFQEFVQIGNLERDRGKGLGLGLAIARRLAGLLNTDITVTSRAGRGSRFSVAQPRSEPTVATPRVVAGPDLVAGLRVLLIDDDRSVREGAALLLRQWGVTLEAAADLAEAEALVGAGPLFDVCLCDYRLPGTLTGLDVIDRLSRGENPPRASCLLTGDMAPEVLIAADAVGISIVHKPVQPARLRALLNHLAARGR